MLDSWTRTIRGVHDQKDLQDRVPEGCRIDGILHADSTTTVFLSRETKSALAATVASPDKSQH